MSSSELVIAPAPTSGCRSRKAGATANSSSGSEEWGPVRNAATNGANMALVAGILLFAFVVGLLFVGTIKFLLHRRGSSRSPLASDPEKSGGKRAAACAWAPTVYAAGATALAGAGADCAICLAEFADGDVLMVLPACRHGFHAECVETWLAPRAAPSECPPVEAALCCPVCRASCLPREDSPESETC
uniref:RING-H2 finger protein ATL79 n=1 Tax=Anthurium amnicola TaxID=1678845 RepID=A0A1D1Y8G7_9ARAE